MSNLEDRLGAYREPMNTARDYSTVVLISLAGLLLSAAIAVALASDAVLLAWANPVG